MKWYCPLKFVRYPGLIICRSKMSKVIRMYLSLKLMRSEIAIFHALVYRCVNLNKNDPSFPCTSFTRIIISMCPPPLLPEAFICHTGCMLHNSHARARRNIIRPKMISSGRWYIAALVDEFSVFTTSLICLSESHQSWGIVRSGYSTRRRFGEICASLIALLEKWSLV